MNLTVVSTSFRAPTRRICEASVRAQTVAAKHIYIEASEQSPPKTVMQNWYEAIAPLPPDEVVVLLDGDDWLARENALELVVAMHEAGALVTYGNYITSDGAPGICAPYARSDCRRESWRASHLKTFRAWLFQQLAPEDLQLDGKWVGAPFPNDVAVMLPLLEMAGQDLAFFCPEVLCVYHLPSSYGVTSGDKAGEKQMEALIRAKPAKARVA